MALLLASMLLGLACGADASDGDDAGTAEPGLRGTIKVFAAASLTDAMKELAATFEDANQEVTVELNFGPSSGLREQILSGAPADVYASANLSNMEQLAQAGEVESFETFARNGLEIAVPAGNPAGVTGLADLENPDLLIGLCAEEVPCGQLGREALAKAEVTPALDTNATDVRALLTQIASGDLDAGIVYRTDVLAAGDEVGGIEIPAEVNVVADYQIATLTGAGNREGASAFATFVLSAEAGEILGSHGFEAV